MQLRQVRVAGSEYKHRTMYNPNLMPPLDAEGKPGTATAYPEWGEAVKDTEGWVGATALDPAFNWTGAGVSAGGNLSGTRMRYPYKADHDELDGENYRFVRGTAAAAAAAASLALTIPHAPSRSSHSNANLQPFSS